MKSVGAFGRIFGKLALVALVVTHVVSVSSWADSSENGSKPNCKVEGWFHNSNEIFRRHYAIARLRADGMGCAELAQEAYQQIQNQVGADATISPAQFTFSETPAENLTVLGEVAASKEFLSQPSCDLALEREYLKNGFPAWFVQQRPFQTDAQDLLSCYNDMTQKLGEGWSFWNNRFARRVTGSFLNPWNQLKIRFWIYPYPSMDRSDAVPKSLLR